MQAYPTDKDLVRAKAAVARLSAPGARPTPEERLAVRQQFNYTRLLRALAVAQAAEGGISAEQQADLAARLASVAVQA